MVGGGGVKETLLDVRENCLDPTDDVRTDFRDEQVPVAEQRPPSEFGHAAERLERTASHGCAGSLYQ